MGDLLLVSKQLDEELRTKDFDLDMVFIVTPDYDLHAEAIVSDRLEDERIDWDDVVIRTVILRDVFFVLLAENIAGKVSFGVEALHVLAVYIVAIRMQVNLVLEELRVVIVSLVNLTTFWTKEVDLWDDLDEEITGKVSVELLRRVTNEDPVQLTFIVVIGARDQPVKVA